MREDERRRLVGTVRDWWNGPEGELYSPEAALSAEEARLLDALPARARVLDVGCGAGRVLRHLADRGHHAVGSDVSPAMLARARRVGSALVQCDAAALAIADASFDAVIAWKVSCYIPSRAARVTFLDGLARVLRPGGVVLLENHLVPSLDEGAAALAADKEHADAAARYESLEGLDTFAAGSGYLHWYTEEDLRAEIADSVLRLESFDRLDNGLMATILLRR